MPGYMLQPGRTEFTPEEERAMRTARRLGEAAGREAPPLAAVAAGQTLGRAVPQIDQKGAAPPDRKGAGFDAEVP